MSNRYFIKTIGQTRKATDKSCRICYRAVRGQVEAPCNQCLDPIDYKAYYQIDPKLKARLEASNKAQGGSVKVRLASIGQDSKKGLKTSFVTITW